MDYRLALLLQLYQGLRLEPLELGNLLSLSVEESFDRHVVTASLTSAPALEFIQARPLWADQALAILERSTERGVRWSYLGQPDYPRSWYRLAKSPPLMSYLGEPVWITHSVLAVVGSRTPMLDTCLWLQRELARFLNMERVAVVSGGARGVDQLAHDLALSSERPTVCVFPSGLLNLYPSGRSELWERVLAAGGCLLSTFPLHEPMRKSAFPVRNRWIAGMAQAVFVAEANLRSGSHLTANLAFQEGRSLATLPVSANSSQGLANLQLIFDGSAQMIRDATDLRGFWQRALASVPGATKSMQTEA